MIDVTFSLEGVEVVSRRLSGLAERAADPISPVADELDRVFMGIMARVFASQGGSTESGAWKPRKDTHGWPILRRTGVLFDSLVFKTSDTISAVAPLYWARGTAVPYAKYHQSNKERKQKAGGGDRLPRRAFIDLTAEDKQALFRPISVYLTGKKASIGLRDRGRPSTEA